MTALPCGYILDGLNEAQKDAVLSTDGPLLISAGPGTGKTLTIVRRIAYLVCNGTDPRDILALTFTNRAALEMRRRTAAMLGKDSGVFIGTLHLLGLQILREARYSDFKLYDREAQLGLLKILLDDAVSSMPRDARRSSRTKIAGKISRVKNLLEDPDEEIKGIYEGYQAALKANDALDFDDLILHTIDVLQDGSLSETVHPFRHIMVDEYQDINPAQYKLLKLLSGRGGTLCVIGDSDQAIYAFRGADVENFLNFEREFHEAKLITLTESYRSTGTILGASDCVIRNNRKRLKKELRPIREQGSRITVISVPDERAEGKVIIKEIEERMGGTSHYRQYVSKTPSTVGNPASEQVAAGNCGFSDFCVIFRTNAQAKTMQESFTESGIPFQVIGGKYPKKGRSMENILSVLRAISGAHDPSAAMTDGLRGEGAVKALGRLRRLREILSLPELIKEVVKEPVVGKCCGEENLVFLDELALQYLGLDPAEALDRFIDELSLLTSDDFDPSADAVALMTLHTAKGLEFRNVFIAGVEESLIPFTMGKEDVDIEEERRLFYVAMTRAMDRLYLVHARSRFIYGERLVQKPSRFLGEIQGETVQLCVPDRKGRPSKSQQIGLF